MISYIKGKIINVYDENTISISTGNIGYEVRVGQHTYVSGDDIELYVHTQMSEYDIVLWGFGNSEEIKLFKMLINVSGIGGRTAQLLIKQKGVDGVVNAITNARSDMLKVTGVGEKTAEKIILELKDKVKAFGIKSDELMEQSNITSSKQVEVLEALTGLGYSKQDILHKFKILTESDKNFFDNSIEEIVKKILKTI